MLKNNVSGKFSDCLAFLKYLFEINFVVGRAGGGAMFGWLDGFPSFCVKRMGSRELCAKARVVKRKFTGRRAVFLVNHEKSMGSMSTLRALAAHDLCHRLHWPA